MNVPQLPAWLVAALGTLVAVLSPVVDGLPSPWAEVLAAVLAVASWLGARATHRMIGRRMRAAHALGAQSGCGQERP